MALLNEEDDKEQEQSNMSPTIPTAAPQQAQPAGQPVNPVVPQSTQVPKNLMMPGAAPAPKQPKRVGTGFTNLNRIMQANQGNRLGQTVAGGVTGQVQNLQSGIQQSQQQFGQQSEAGRLDTPEAAAQRASVLGRFDTANFKPDESKFAVSSGLQSNYDTQKSTLSAQQAAQKAASDKQRAIIQARYDADNRALAAANTAAQSGGAMSRVMAMNKAKTLKASLSSLKGLLRAYTGSAASIDADTAAKLANIESEYGTMSATEKDNWIKAEQERMVSEQLPTDEEAENFRRFQTGTYTGPQELQDYQSLLGKAQQTEELGTLARSSGGRQELLKQFVGGRDYTQGQRGLDSALLGQGDNSLLSRAAKKAFGAEKGVNQANLIASNQARELTGKAKLFGEETRGKIADARAPISQEVDADVAAAQQTEAKRQSALKNYQDILAGTDPKYKGMSQLTRTAVALQDAANSGYLSQSDLSSLMGDDSRYGLVERGLKSGVDISKLLGGALTGTNAQNINRAGVASGADVARLNALDRLSGRQASESEFRPENRYRAGGMGFDQAALQKAINEAEGYKEPVYGKPGVFKPTSTQQMLGGLGGVLGQGGTTGGLTGAGVLTGTAGVGALLGSLGGAGAGAGAMSGLAAGGPLAAAAMLGADLLTGGDSTAQAAEGTVNLASGAGRAGLETNNAIMKKIGTLGGIINDKHGGAEIKQLLDWQTGLEQKGLGELTKEGLNAADGLRDLTQRGRMDQAFAKLSGYDAMKNLYTNAGKTASTALFGGKTGNWDTSEYRTIDAKTGKSEQIGSYANKSSQDILKQMLSKGQMGRTGSSGKGGAEGAKAMNELLKYYQAALKREHKKK